MPQQVKKQPHDKPAYKIWWGFQMTKKELEAKCFFIKAAVVGRGPSIDPEIGRQRSESLAKDTEAREKVSNDGT